LEGAVVGSVIETNIEGIDREFKVTKAQKVFFHNKSGDMFTHPLEVMKNHSFKFNAELKSHYELVAEILQDFTKVKAKITNKN
jgi:capsule polysaccharide modification protein KpsS